MTLQECVSRRADAAAEFDDHEQGETGVRVANSLSFGFSALRTALFTRIHDDVVRYYGNDSMLSPVSLKGLQKMEANSKVEIEIYQVAVSCEEIRDRGYVRDHAWYREWLSRLRLGELAQHEPVRQRLAHYLEEERSERRLDFVGVLVRSAPEASKAPLILYRLFPLAVRLATDLAFGDHLAAADARNKQIAILPHIVDCRECHGRPLDNGEQCPLCGNPVWKFEWLRAVD